MSKPDVVPPPPSSTSPPSIDSSVGVTSRLPPPPSFTTSFKSVLPPISFSKHFQTEVQQLPQEQQLTHSKHGIRLADGSKIVPRDYRRITWDDIDKSKFYFAMPACTFIVRTLLYPLTVLKTRQQTTIPIPHKSASIPPIHVQQVSSAIIRPYRPSVVDLSTMSTRKALMHVLEKEGFRALYSGFGVAMLGLVVSPVYITSLETTRSYLQDLHRKAFPPTHQSSAEPQTFAFLSKSVTASLISLISGAAASCAAQVLGVPLDVISNRQMKGSSLPRSYLGAKSWRGRAAFFIVRDVYRIEGFKGFYKGYWLTLMHNAPMSAVVWGAFDIVHPVLGKLLHPVSARINPPKPIIAHPEQVATATASTPVNAHVANSSSSTLPSTKSTHVTFTPPTSAVILPPVIGGEKWNLLELCIVFVSAAICGGTAATVTLPIDTVKTRLQTTDQPNSSMRSVYRQLKQEAGWKGLFKGLRPRLHQSMVNSGMLMTLYEVLKRWSLREDVGVVKVIPNHKHQHH